MFLSSSRTTHERTWDRTRISTARSRWQDSRLIFLVVQSSKNYQRAKSALALGTSPRAAVVAKLQERILLPSERNEMNSAYDLDCSELCVSFRKYPLIFLPLNVTVCLSRVKCTFSRTIPLRNTICIPCCSHLSINIHTYIRTYIRRYNAYIYTYIRMFIHSLIHS
jgi:hypothetical protein